MHINTHIINAYLIGQSLGNGDFTILRVGVLIEHALVDGVEAHPSGLDVLVSLRDAVGAEDAVEVVDDAAIDGIFFPEKCQGIRWRLGYECRAHHHQN